MSLNASKSKNKGGKEITPVPAGSYPGRLVVLADLGLQPQRPYQGDEKAPAYEILVTFELSDEFMVDEDGNEDKTKPRWVSDNFPLYPLQSARANSTKAYLALDPEAKYGGDWSQLIEAPVMITVVVNESKNGRKYNNIAGLAPMRPKDAARLPALVNTPVVFNIDEPDIEAFKKLPEWIQKKIKEGLEYKGSALEKTLGGTSSPPTNTKKDEEEDEEIPF